MLRQGPISALVHGLVEYAAAALLIAAPFLFGFDSEAARALAIVAGVGVIVLAATTDFAAGLSRTLPVGIHVVLDLALVAVLIAAPFVFGFSLGAGAVSIALGILLTGLALSIYGEADRAQLPLQAHAGFDYVIAAITIALGIAIGFAAGDFAAGIFMVGFGSAHLALTASTRFSRPLGT